MSSCKNYGIVGEVQHFDVIATGHGIRRLPFLKKKSGDLRGIPDTTPEHVIARIADLFRSKRISFERVACLSRREPPRVRALLSAIGSSIGADPDVLNELKGSLNPMTHFSLGLSDKLETALEWNIR